MNVVSAATASGGPRDSGDENNDDGGAPLSVPEPLWVTDAEHRSEGHLLVWEGLAGQRATWQARTMTVWRGRLYLSQPAAVPPVDGGGDAGPSPPVGFGDPRAVRGSGSGSGSVAHVPSAAEAASAVCRTYWQGMRLLQLPPSYLGGERHCLALVPDGVRCGKGRVWTGSGVDGPDIRHSV